MKVYVVLSNHGEYEDYQERIEAVFSDSGDAQKFKEDFDKEHIIRHEHEDYTDDIYSIVPMDVLDDWPYEETYDGGSYDIIYVGEYQGYTLEQRDRQEGRVSLAYMGYGECRIEAYDVHETYPYKTADNE